MRDSSLVMAFRQYCVCIEKAMGGKGGGERGGWRASSSTMTGALMVYPL